MHRLLPLSSLLVLLLASAGVAHASRPIPLHHRETPYVGPSYWSTVDYTRGYSATVTRDLTIRGIAILADFDASESCEARVYDGVGVLRASGEPQSGLGTGSGAAVGWWSLPVETELFAGEQVTLAVYCTSSSSTAFYEHRDAPGAPPSAQGYFTDIANVSLVGDGFPSSNNTWWGDWRVEIEAHGLHAEYPQASTASTGSMSNSRGAILTTTRAHSITAVDFFADLGVGESCTPRVFDAGGTMIAEGTSPLGDGAGLGWYRSDLAVGLDAGTTYTMALYCPQTTTVGWSWNDPTTYPLLDDAIGVHGRSGGAGGTMPTSVNQITPVMQFLEGEAVLTRRDGFSDPIAYSTWSSWTWGWNFTPETYMVVEGLEALLRMSAGTGVARIYETASGTLIASGTQSMPVSDGLEWRLAPLPRTLLQPGVEYTVAVFYDAAFLPTSPYVSSSAGPHTRAGLMSDIQFCGSNSSSDVMPTNCNYNHRLERLRIELPEPGFGVGLALGIGGLGLCRRGSRSSRRMR